MYRAETEIKFKGLYFLIEKYCKDNRLLIVDDEFNILIENEETGEDIDIRDIMEVYQ